jgi:hypothetical protein
VNVNIFSTQAAGGSTCVAQTGSQELAQVVSLQMSAGGKAPAATTGSGAPPQQ